MHWQITPCTFYLICIIIYILFVFWGDYIHIFVVFHFGVNREGGGKEEKRGMRQSESEEGAEQGTCFRLMMLLVKFCYSAPRRSHVGTGQRRSRWGPDGHENKSLT